MSADFIITNEEIIVIKAQNPKAKAFIQKFFRQDVYQSDLYDTFYVERNYFDDIFDLIISEGFTTNLERIDKCAKI